MAPNSFALGEAHHGGLQSPNSPTRARLFSGYGGHDEKDRARATESVRVAARVRPHTQEELSRVCEHTDTPVCLCGFAESA
jgi:hypothetical protein